MGEVGLAHIGGVGIAAAGHADLELLAGETALSQDDVAGVHGDALGAVGGGCVAELGGGAEVHLAESDCGSGVHAAGGDAAVPVRPLGDAQEGAVAEVFAVSVDRHAVILAGDDSVAAAGGQAIGEGNRVLSIDDARFNQLGVGSLLQGGHGVVVRGDEDG